MPDNQSVGRVIAIHQGRAGPPLRDDRFMPVVDWVLANNVLGQPFLVPVRFTENRDQADDVRRSLYNAARYFCSCGKLACTRKWGNVPGQNKDNPAGGCPRGGMRISCQARLVMHQGHVRVEFRFFDKKEAIREVIAKYGPDPDDWPYYAKRKKAKEANG